MECFSAVKFTMGYAKNMSFLPKSPKVWKKKVEKIGLSSFNILTFRSFTPWSCESRRADTYIIVTIKTDAIIQTWLTTAWINWIKRNWKGFSDSNNFLWHDSEDINKKAYFQNFSWFQFYVFKLCVIVAPIDYRVELSLLNKTFCENCCNFILKWF